jgi:hypothetical protein
LEVDNTGPEWAVADSIISYYTLNYGLPFIDRNVFKCGNGHGHAVADWQSHVAGAALAAAVGVAILARSGLGVGAGGTLQLPAPKSCLALAAVLFNAVYATS